LQDKKSPLDSLYYKSLAVNRENYLTLTVENQKLKNTIQALKDEFNESMKKQIDEVNKAKKQIKELNEKIIFLEKEK
jgi:flagellar hook-associated protein FlgK